MTACFDGFIGRSKSAFSFSFCSRSIPDHGAKSSIIFGAAGLHIALAPAPSPLRRNSIVARNSVIFSRTSVTIVGASPSVKSAAGSLDFSTRSRFGRVIEQTGNRLRQCVIRVCFRHLSTLNKLIKFAMISRGIVRCARACKTDHRTNT